MKIAAQFYSRLREITGTATVTRNLPDGARVADLLVALYREFPELGKWDAHILVAIGVDYAQRDVPLREGDTVAIMPPVSGG